MIPFRLHNASAVVSRREIRLQCVMCASRIWGKPYKCRMSSNSAIPSSVSITSEFRSKAEGKRKEDIIKQNEPPLFRDYKNLMARLPVPVVVLTTSSSDGIIHRGMTLSSLTSLSIPQSNKTVKSRPLISFNIRVPSHTASSLDEQPRFIINVLPPTNESARLCRTFSGSLGANIDPFTQVMWHWGKWIEDCEGDTTSELKIPVLDTSGAVMYCKRIQSIPFYDHELCVAEVSKIQVSPLQHHHNNMSNKNKNILPTRQPANDGMQEFSSIMYFERQFQDICGDILVNDETNSDEQ